MCRFRRWLLSPVLKEIKKMVDSQTDLDTALTAVGALVTTLIAECTALIAKIQANPTGDFTNEVTALNAMGASIQTAITQAKAVTGS